MCIGYNNRLCVATDINISGLKSVLVPISVGGGGSQWRTYHCIPWSLYAHCSSIIPLIPVANTI